MEPFRKLMKLWDFTTRGKRINACLHIYIKLVVALQTS